MKGRVLHVATGYIPAMLERFSVDPLRPQLNGLRGAMLDFFHDSMISDFNPPPNITLTDWATEQSIRNVQKLSDTNASIYTACVYDVAVGNADVCIADIWLTSARASMATFLPPLYNDVFFLVVEEIDSDRRGLTREVLLKPFAPFTFWTWALIVAFLLFAAFVTFVTDFRNTNDFPYAEKGAYLLRAGKSCYFSFMGFFAAGAQHEALTIPSKIAMLGFTFFVLITISSYTANLASILVVQHEQNIDIASIQDAVAASRRICIPKEIKDPLVHKYPRVETLLIPVDSISMIPRSMHKGDCSVAIMYERSISRMHAGAYVEKDCDQMQAGELEASDAFCEDPSHVDHDRDCSFVKVGEYVLQIPIAWPVADHLRRSLAWSMVQNANKGIYEEAKMRYHFMIPGSHCSKIAPEKEVGMPPTSMLGTVILSTVFMTLALMLSAVERWTGRRMLQLLRYDSHECQEEQELALSKDPTQPPPSHARVGKGLHKMELMLHQMSEKVHGRHQGSAELVDEAKPSGQMQNIEALLHELASSIRAPKGEPLSTQGVFAAAPGPLSGHRPDRQPFDLGGGGPRPAPASAKLLVGKEGSEEAPPRNGRLGDEGQDNDEGWSPDTLNISEEMANGGRYEKASMDIDDLMASSIPRQQCGGDRLRSLSAQDAVRRRNHKKEDEQGSSSSLNTKLGSNKMGTARKSPRYSPRGESGSAPVVML
jgi:hypothetical protein